MNKRHMAIGLLAGLAGASLATASVAAAAAGTVTEAEASAAVLAWLDALATHDPATVGKILAPEFQIQRSDGTGFDRAGYLGNLPKLSGKPEIQNLAFAAAGDLLVARYNLRIEEKIGDTPVQALAPRLSVLRRDGAGWLMVAHANFAKIG